MVILGIDAHKGNHTAVAVDEAGRKLGERTTGTTTADHLQLLCWAEQFGDARTWAVEDCGHLSRRLERDLLGAGEQIVRVPPKMMAHARDGALLDDAASSAGFGFEGVLASLAAVPGQSDGHCCIKRFGRRPR